MLLLLRFIRRFFRRGERTGRHGGRDAGNVSNGIQLYASRIRACTREHSQKLRQRDRDRQKERDSLLQFNLFARTFRDGVASSAVPGGPKKKKKNGVAHGNVRSIYLFFHVLKLCIRSTRSEVKVLARVPNRGSGVRGRGGVGRASSKPRPIG